MMPADTFTNSNIQSSQNLGVMTASATPYSCARSIRAVAATGEGRLSEPGVSSDALRGEGFT